MIHPFRTARLAAVAASLVSAAISRPVAAQTGGAGTGGVARLAQERLLAGNWRRVLMIGAHPDDEDTELITILARGMGIETAYLSLTRGDGGQNLIGPELGEMLGVLRTEELASARKIDGGLQFFTRAFDFGFSKTAEESLRLWNGDSVLKDMVRIIRRFRPQVIVSVWQGTPADGHGHHVASGILSLQAYHAAGDSTRFPELRREGLAPWQPSKFYRSAGRGGGAAAATLTFNGGVIDPATGLSLRQLAARSRSQHRSQNQGNFEDLGQSRTGVRLEERVATITGKDDSLFAGIAPEAVDRPDRHAAEARLIEAGIVLDATTNDDEVTPGQVLPVTLTAWNTGHDTAFIRFAMVPHGGFTSRGDRCPQEGERPVAPGELFSCDYATTVTDHAMPTMPYYLHYARVGSLYQWGGANVDVLGEPSEPPLEASFRFSFVRGTMGRDAMMVTREVAARFRDPVLGEVRKPVMIVQPIAVDIQPSQMLWPLGTRTRPFKVQMEHLARDSADATVSLTVPDGWKTTPLQRVHFSREGERTVATFTVTAPINVRAGEYQIAAEVISGHDTLDTGLYRIRYPHIRDRNLVTAAQARVVVADVKFPQLATIGYVRGGGDQVPEAMIYAGLHIEMLTGDALERGSLDRFKVIVIGPRAYEADESLVHAHPRLMRWLDAGGTLIIQYEQRPYMLGGFPPRPLTFVQPTQSRVTDETAAVTFLAPKHPVVRWPNIIGPDDFKDWVQERGLDYPSQHDAVWTPIFSMHDPNEQPLDGGLLIAKVGKGTAVYTGLAFHRQLPAIIPGAWRLWANILGVGQTAAAARPGTSH
jgi:LmbE family N-acetylglucosaminyl deacetylase